ncbi:MAG: DUF5309 family protein [Planctomycetota bacterium]
MAFTGKATYDGGATLPEIAEDVSDLVAIASPHDTPLLEALGEAKRPARSTIHEWLEDTLLPNFGVVDGDDGSSTITVEYAAIFRVGDQLRLDGSDAMYQVTAVDTATDELTVTRGFAGSPSVTAQSGDVLHIVGNAALEGADAEAARFTARTRKSNVTQIFAATVEVSGSELAVNQLGIRDELDYQKAQRLRELMRDLENSVINGYGTGSVGSDTTRRSFKGLRQSIATNIFKPGVSGFPADTALTEAQLNQALRTVWESSAGNVDLIVVGGTEKRQINSFMTANRQFAAGAETFKDRVATYESDFGECKVVLSRWVPSGSALLLDSSRIDVLPLAGRSFHYKPLARTGDKESGQILGEYTVEIRNENAHGVITGLG